MAKRLILIHGRSQAGKDPGSLKEEWISALRQGLDHCGLTLPISNSDIDFPYYGDALEQALSKAHTAPVVWRGDEFQADELPFLHAVLHEVATQVGVTDEEIDVGLDTNVIERGFGNWDMTLALARAIDTHMGVSSSAAIMLATRDVHAYLTKSAARLAVDDIVKPFFREGDELIVVGHSLGSVVAYRLIESFACQNRCKIALFLTLGSPLAVSHIRSKLQPIRRPGCVTNWFNARDPNDTVALFPLDQSRFNVTPAIENYSSVANDTENKHGITGYLKDPTVAKLLHDSLM